MFSFRRRGVTAVFRIHGGRPTGHADVPALISARTMAHHHQPISFEDAVPAPSHHAPKTDRVECEFPTSEATEDEHVTMWQIAQPLQSSLLDVARASVTLHPMAALATCIERAFPVLAQRTPPDGDANHITRAREASRIMHGSLGSIEQVRIVTATALRRLHANFSDAAVDSGTSFGGHGAVAPLGGRTSALDLSNTASGGAAVAATSEDRAAFAKLDAALYPQDAAAGHSVGRWVHEVGPSAMEALRETASCGGTEFEDVMRDISSSVGLVAVVLQRHLLMAAILGAGDSAARSADLLLTLRSWWGRDTVSVAPRIPTSQRQIAAGSGGHVAVTPVPIPLYTWRVLRDAIAAFKTNGHFDAALVVLVSTIERIQATARVGAEGGTAPTLLSELVTPAVVVSVVECIRTARHLSTFRSLFAASAGVIGGGLEHIPVSDSLYTALIAACGRARDEPDRLPIAMALFRGLADNAIAPSEQTYAALMEVSASTGEASQTFALYHEAKRKLGDGQQLLEPRAFNALIEGYVEAGFHFDALATANVLIEAGAPLTRPGFEAVMVAAAAQGDFPAVQHYLRVMSGQASLVAETDGMPAANYGIPLRAGSLVPLLTALCYSQREVTWRDRLTIIGDVTKNAMSLFLATNPPLPDVRLSDRMRQLIAFAEHEPQFSYVLQLALARTMAPPDVYRNPRAVPAAITAGASPAATGTIAGQGKRDAEMGLYRRHVADAVAIAQLQSDMWYTQMTQEYYAQTPTPSTMRRVANLFRSQRPSVMPYGARVAVLMPDLVLHFDALTGGADMASPSTSVDAAVAAAGDLGEFMEALLPYVSSFYIPFATLQVLRDSFQGYELLQKKPLRDILLGAGPAAAGAVAGSLDEKKHTTGARRLMNEAVLVDPLLDPAAVTTLRRQRQQQLGASVIALREEELAHLATASLRLHDVGHRESIVKRALFSLARFLEKFGPCVHVGSFGEDLQFKSKAVSLKLQVTQGQDAAAVSACGFVGVSDSIETPSIYRDAQASMVLITADRRMRRLSTDETRKNVPEEAVTPLKHVLSESRPRTPRTSGHLAAPTVVVVHPLNLPDWAPLAPSQTVLAHLKKQ